MSTMTTIPATPAKLHDGSWGARTMAPVAVGDVVTITTRAGKSWTARVSRVVWTGEGVSILATQNLAEPRAAMRPATHRRGGGCHTDGNCSSVCSPRDGSCPCADGGGWFRCC